MQEIKRLLMPKRFKQVAVLSSFFFLLVVFIAYRSGVFDTYLNPSPKDYSAMFLEDNTTIGMNAMAIDSPPPSLPDSAKRRMMHGSKSGAVIETFRNENSDTIKTAPVKKTRTIMRGSKSGVFFTPADTTKKTKPDSLRKTTMNNSKFGGIIRPVWTDAQGDIVFPTWNSTLRKWKTVKEKHELQVIIMSGSKSVSLYDPRVFMKEEEAYQLARAIETGIILPRNDSAQRVQQSKSRN
jgi:hypothetical protein